MHAIALTTCLAFCAAVAQTAALPAFAPAGWQPDAGALLAFAALPYLEAEVWLVLVFALGLQADVFGSPRLGLLTLSYLLAAGALLGFRREAVRAGAWGGWLAAMGGTLLAHALFLPLAALAGVGPAWGDVLTQAPRRAFGAACLGLPAAWLLGLFIRRLGLLAQDARAWRVAGRR